MNRLSFGRLPRHIGIIPDGNRRWAEKNGYEKQDGYQFGIAPGFELYKTCLELGIQEMTFYGFTIDNTKRPSVQTKAFQSACVDAVRNLANQDADLLIVGNTESPLFPKELLPYSKRVRFGRGLMKVNFLVNYGWNWDLNCSLKNSEAGIGGNMANTIASSDISRIDLIIRWGGRRRLSGFLPIQSIYADIYVLDELWPDFKPEQFYRALAWYQDQDVTLGG
ncbi:undecaprenyl diphosphate synthase family protein [Caproiciproducens sp. R2]|uniref:undecaprenyl diphosphate synthase family protein n=1 Tax=Caproiciproducens sp. R2 TaxID=3435187 RepID=UPI00403354F9